MEIYITKQGDTINSIADQYNISVQRLIQDNGVTVSRNLVPGQTIVIAYPKESYTVLEGDTLSSIADNSNITVKQLLKNNPFLIEREYIYPGESLVVSYDKSNKKTVTTGYANSYIDLITYKKSLLYLTYISIFGYRTKDDGSIINIDDEKLIKIAKEFGVAPLMFLSTFGAEGIGSVEATYLILYNQDLVDYHIDEAIRILDEKGYYGLNITLEYLSKSNTEAFENFVIKLSKNLNSRGYKLFITIIPNLEIRDNELTYENIDYSRVIDNADGVMFISYFWGYSFGPPTALSSVNLVKSHLDYALKLVPRDITNIGIPILGYNWELPYIIGITKASSLTINSAIELAKEMGATIQYDETSEAPNYHYIEKNPRMPLEHVVWFVDARTIDAFFTLKDQYGIEGLGFWNIMIFYPQFWLVINSQYEIEAVPFL